MGKGPGIYISTLEFSSIINIFMKTSPTVIIIHKTWGPHKKGLMPMYRVQQKNEFIPSDQAYELVKTRTGRILF